MSEQSAETPEAAQDARSPEGDHREHGSGEERERDSGGEERERDSREHRKPRLLQRRGVRIGLIVAIVVLVVAGVIWWLHARNYVSTDDAFIDTHIVRFAPRVSGQVTAVYASDNELVRAGALLATIDPSDYRAQLDQAVSRAAEARTAIAQAAAQLQASEAAYQQSLANLASARAQAAKAQSDLQRYRGLKAITPQAVAQQQLDQATAAARSAAADQRAAQQQTHTAAAQIATAHAQQASSEAALRTAEAQVRLAELNLSYTTLRAPIDGHVAQKSVALGDYVTPGQQLMAIVPLNVWVTANFKETALDELRRNQPVQVHVDACPSADIRGHVDSIQRGAGQAFALLPPENATGNYVKVVQRVPVKIVLDRVPDGCPLGPGMSVEPTVTVR